MPEQESRGLKRSDEQRHWLEMIRDHAAANLDIETDDFEYTPFAQKDGLGNVQRLFPDGLQTIIETLNVALVAEREESMSTAEQIFKEAQKLPDTLAQEVLDFIGYIEIKHGLRDRLTEELKQAQEPAMHHVWDNQDDEVWNGV